MERLPEAQERLSCASGKTSLCLEKAGKRRFEAKHAQFGSKAAVGGLTGLMDQCHKAMPAVPVLHHGKLVDRQPVVVVRLVKVQHGHRRRGLCGPRCAIPPRPPSTSATRRQPEHRAETRGRIEFGCFRVERLAVAEACGGAESWCVRCSVGVGLPNFLRRCARLSICATMGAPGVAFPRMQRAREELKTF